MGNMTVPSIAFAEAIDRVFAGKTHAPYEKPYEN